jgi:hypothetical protein
MRMLIDLHEFSYRAAVPWPGLDDRRTDWEQGVNQIEGWLLNHVGDRLTFWAWDDSHNNYYLGVGFLLKSHQTLFLLRWSH